MGRLGVKIPLVLRLSSGNRSYQVSLTPLRRGLAALSLLVILAGCGTSQQPRSDAPPPRALAPPRVLVSTPGLFAFAQDGGQLAWWRDEPGDAYPALHIRTIATGAETRIRGRDALPGFGGDGFSITFAFAGGRALWSDFSHGNFGYEHLKTASLSDRSVRTLDEWEYLEEGEEHDFNMAGDGTTLVYTIGGSPMRVAGPKAVPVPGAPEAFAVAVSGRRAALLRQAGIDDNYRPFSDENTPVEVRDVQRENYSDASSTAGEPRRSHSRLVSLSFWSTRSRRPELRPTPLTTGTARPRRMSHRTRRTFLSPGRRSSFPARKQFTFSTRGVGASRPWRSRREHPSASRSKAAESPGARTVG